jgi:TM2 domain-containing membrane protein YozV
MNCQNHPDIPATAYCRTCGKPVCDQCRCDAYGTVFCAEHAPVPAANPNAPLPPPGAIPVGAVPLPGYPHPEVSPGMALFLGFIPGVGAIYNGQYVKGLVHAVIFGIIISILDSNIGGLDVVFAFVLTAWIFYMAFEAQHTALKRRNGEAVDEYSSILSFRGSNAPVAGVVLVVLGVLLLLNTLDLVNFAYLTRYWPVLLIAAGVYLLYARLGGQKNER